MLEFQLLSQWIVANNDTHVHIGILHRSVSTITKQTHFFFNIHTNKHTSNTQHPPPNTLSMKVATLAFVAACFAVHAEAGLPGAGSMERLKVAARKFEARRLVSENYRGEGVDGLWDADDLGNNRWLNGGSTPSHSYGGNTYNRGGYIANPSPGAIERANNAGALTPSEYNRLTTNRDEDADDLGLIVNFPTRFQTRIRDEDADDLGIRSLSDCYNRCPHPAGQCGYQCRVDYNDRKIKEAGLKNPLGDCYKKRCKREGGYGFNQQCTYQCRVDYNLGKLK